MKFLLSVVSILVLTASQSALAKLNVLACEAEWAALAVAIGGSHVKVHSATTALQDPHYVQARPSLIAKTRRADFVVCSGAELEIGWLPILLRKSANARVQPGGAGYFMATDYVDLLDKPLVLDRSAGDVHASGNPHIHINPHHMLTVADALTAKFAEADPDNAEEYRRRSMSLAESLQTLLAERAADIESFNGKSIVVHHDAWVYLSQWLGLKKVATLEPKPGIPPTSRHLSSLVSQLTSDPADAIIYASYQDERASSWLAGKTGLPKIGLSYSVNDWQQDDALVDWYRDILDQLLSAIQ